MLPNKSCDSVTCLQSLVGVKEDCANSDCYNYYISDIEGVDLKALASIAGPQNVSGVQMAKDIINISAREMLGDIDMLIANGFSLKETFGDLCSTCTFLTIYQAGGGVKVQNVITSLYSVLRIQSIEALTNFTGAAVLILNDGVEAKTYDVELVAGVISPITLNYSTQQKFVKIYFQDTSIGMAQISCPTIGGCGCGGTRNRDATSTIKYTGLVNQADTSTQYGFKVCASVGCSSDLLVCALIQQVPNVFGLTLLYKVGQKYFADARLSTRNNRVAGQDSEQKETMSDYYAALYNRRLNGSKDTKGVRLIINNYLRQRNDKCVVCDGLSKVGWATG
jgi:hypothetical protein